MPDEPYRIMAINFGSTSSKVGLFENNDEVLRLTVEHPRAEIEKCGIIAGQISMRRDVVLAFLNKSKISVGDLSAISARTGILSLIETGAYRVNKKMLESIANKPIADHAANLCAVIAYEIAEPFGIPVYT